MPTELKTNFQGGLNLDTSYYLLPPNSYADALNMTTNAVIASQDNIGSPIVGNRIAGYTLPRGQNVVIGAYAWYPYVYYFVWNSANHHSILEFNTGTRAVVKVFESLTDSATDILNFTQHDKINSINIYESIDGKLLFFLDSLGRPTGLSIPKFIAGTYTPVTREIIDVLKVPPLVPPSNIWGNDATRNSNDCRNKLFRFRYRWRYDENQKSCWSSFGSLPLPADILDETFTSVITNNNILFVSVGTGGKDVKQIEIGVSISNKTNTWGDLQSAVILDKAELGIIDNSDYTFSFYNNSTYPVVDVHEANLLFDYVPDSANAQEMPLGNTLLYAGIREGLSRDLEPNVVINVLTTPASSGGSSGTLSGVLTYNNVQFVSQRMEYTFSGVPAAGTVIQIKVRRKSDGVEFFTTAYTTLVGDTADTVSIQLVANNTGPSITSTHPNAFQTRVVIPFSVYEALPSNGYYSELIITPPSTSLAPNSTATWKWSTSRFLGIQYYNYQGKTNGVLYSSEVVFPAYAESAGSVLLPYMNVKIYHVPPLWAATYQFVFTKEPTQYKFWVTPDVNTTDADYLFFDVTNLELNQLKYPTTAAVLNYTFQDGDRMRLIRNEFDGTVYADTYDALVYGKVTDPKINNATVTGTFIKIKKVAPFSTADYSSKNFVIELYRAGLQQANDEDLTYYELGEEFPIVLDSTGQRVHGGGVTNQDIALSQPAETNITEGDSYFRSRSIVLSETGEATFNVQDRNFVDIYTSAVSTVDGRPTEIDKDSKPTDFYAMLRYSEDVEPNTNVNNLNRFYPLNFQDCDYSFGAIKRLKAREKFIRVFQEEKVGQLPLYSELVKDSTGSNNLAVTDKLINPINYYVGNNGIGSASESLASMRFADYFCDNYRGQICRVSDDGITVLSVLYKVNSWASMQLPLRTGNSKIYGVFEAISNKYIIALEDGNERYDAGTIRYGYTTCNGLAVDAQLVYGHSAEFCALNDTVSGAPTEAFQVEEILDYDCAGAGDCRRWRVTNIGLAVNPAVTLAFAEDNNSFETFLSFHPEMMVNVGNLLITFLNGALWTHDSDLYNNFYGLYYDSYITLIFNKDVAIRKKYMSLGYQSDDVLCSPVNGDIISNTINPQTNLPQISSLLERDFVLEENTQTASFLFDANSKADARLALVNGDFIGGTWLSVKFVRRGAGFFFFTQPYITWIVSQRNF